MGADDEAKEVAPTRELISEMPDGELGTLDDEPWLTITGVELGAAPLGDRADVVTSGVTDGWLLVMILTVADWLASADVEVVAGPLGERGDAALGEKTVR